MTPNPYTACLAAIDAAPAVGSREWNENAVALGWSVFVEPVQEVMELKTGDRDGTDSDR